MSEMKRREFIVGSAAATVGLTCFGTGLRAALSQARKAGKPLLTEANLNAFIKANPLRLQKGQNVSAEAIRDLDGFIQNHFYVTAAQIRELESIPAEDKSKLIDAIKDMREKKGSVTVHIVGAVRAEQDLSKAHHVVPSFPKISISAGHNDTFGWYVVVTVTKNAA